jgi:ketosteroid isomerase-like protein
MDSLGFVECQRTLYRFARALDAGDFEAVAATMAEDGVWFRQGERLEGRAAVVAALNKRGPSVLTRHLITNIVIDEAGADRAISHCTVLVFRDESGTPQPVALVSPRTVSDYEDRFVRREGRWQIAERRSTSVFVKS